MRRILLVTAIAVSPSLALAQGADPDAGGEAAPGDGTPARAEEAPAEPPPPPSPVDPGAAPVTAVPPVDQAPVPEEEWSPTSPPPKGWRLMLSDLTIIRLNPIGLETRARFGLQKRLFYSEKAITKNNFLFVGLYPKLNPASAQLGVGGELQPASIFNLKLNAEVQQFFGTFGYLQSFDSADANFSDNQLDILADDPATEPEKATMLHLSIAPLLQVKVLKEMIAIRSLLQLDYWRFDMRDDNPTVYEPTFDTLLPNNGWTLSTDTDVLYTGKQNLAIGLRHTWVRPLYSEEHFSSQALFDAYDNENAHHRLGLFAAYTFKDKGPSTFNKPTVVLILSWYLRHKYRTGEPDTIPTGYTSDDYVTRAFPYVIVGFAFESDFLKINMGR